MESLSNALNTALKTYATSDELVAKALRAQKVKEMWKAVVDPVFLNHTNSVYIIQDEGKKTLIVYVDDSLFAAELNARREIIKLKLLQEFGEDIQDFQIKISWGKYKRTYLYADEENIKTTLDFDNQKVNHLSDEQRKEFEVMVESIPNENVRKAVLKAIISDFEQKTQS